MSHCRECGFAITGPGFCSACRGDVGRMMKRLVLELRDDERVRIARRDGGVTVKVVRNAAKRMLLVEAHVASYAFHGDFGEALVRCVEELEALHRRREAQ